MNKTRFLACISGVVALSLVGCTAARPGHPYQKTNHFKAQHPPMVSYYQGHKRVQMPRAQASRAYMRPSNGRYGPPKKMAHHQTQQVNTNIPQFQQWVDYEPQYKIYPGDQLDIVVSSAPELSRTLTVGPDGRIVMPMTPPIMAAGRTFTQVQNALSEQLGKQLRDPRIAVTPRAYGPEQIFVGGAVGQQGTYTLPGPIGAIEAIFMAGGFAPTAKASKVAVLRRAPNGGMMMRTVNIGKGMRNMRHYNDVLQLRRGDIIFVPRTTLAEIGLFVEQLRGAVPFDYNLSYQFGDTQGGTTVISP